VGGAAVLVIAISLFILYRRRRKLRSEWLGFDESFTSTAALEFHPDNVVWPSQTAWRQSVVPIRSHPDRWQSDLLSSHPVGGKARVVELGPDPEGFRQRESRAQAGATTNFASVAVRPIDNIHLDPHDALHSPSASGGPAATVVRHHFDSGIRLASESQVPARSVIDLPPVYEET
jgi:hypothetical protein